MSFDDDFEMDLYSKILDVYQNKQLDKESIEIWKNKAYIDLMRVLERTKNKELVKNAIILILSLFEEFPIDRYETYGINTKELKNDKKKAYLSEMKMELFSEIPN